MITGSQEYQDFLANIAIHNGSYNPPNTLIRIPTDEKIYDVNWETRVIESPASIGVEADHEAEYIFFRMDRFVDQMDLASCVGIIQFKNANLEEFYQVIPSYDILSERGKIIFAWDVQSPATKYAGTVTFSFKFFKVNPASRELLYDLNTLVAKTRVSSGWASTDGYEHSYKDMTAEKILFNDSNIAIALQELHELGEDFAIYWYDTN